jgi:uncharacterized membrane protein YdbT with pleckstrin-like domain
MSFTKKQLLTGETLIILTRQHPLTLFWPVLLNVVVLAILIVISYYQSPWFMVFYVFPLIYLLWEWMAWHRGEYILTDRRVVKQEGVFSISSFDASLDKINNVFHQQSFMGRLLKYGDVGLETASEQGTTVFSFLSNPLAFKNAIVHQRELYNTDSRNSAKAPPQISVPQLIDELASLRDRQIITEAEFQEKKKALLERL